MTNYKLYVFMCILAVSVKCDDDQEKYVSEHELPKENIPTRPDYRGEGHWATPAPDSGIDLGFIPLKMYTQKVTRILHMTTGGLQKKRKITRIMITARKESTGKDQEERK
ncbi:hypothetical protein C0J52_25454 [Blattella germanica]|nr:hypothetical protein C0J52_25454 [Blattella germanica]